ncbi:hypothetical protein [Kitasatospora sp. NPDC093558]|uniref:hypothetical protein n=1 Tax=Kitasatospora sp. NPDC093558 TaxID=3155201 RepID=UPI003444321D
MTQIAPLVVTRVCGLPADAVDALRADGTVSGVRRAVDAEDRARRLADALGDALHAVVPGLDRAARRAVLRLRRDAHNLRLTEATGAAADLAAQWVDGPTAGLLDSWREAVRDAQAALADARTAAATELPAAGRAVLDRLADPRVARGLALASPDFTRELLGRPAAGAPGWDARLARTATAYLTRTALKPSPFGTLTMVGAAALPAPLTDGPAPSSGDHTAGHTAVSSSRAAALHLLHLWACAPEAPDWIRLLPHPGVRGGLAALPLYGHAAGVFLREDEVTDVSTVRGILAELPAEPVSVGEAARLLGVGPEDIARFVAMGLLLPVTPWELSDGRHFTALAAAAAGSPHPVAEAVRTLADSEELVARGARAAERTAAVGRARAALGAAHAALRRRPPDWLPDAGLLHEAVAHPAGHSALPLPASFADLRVLGAELGRQVRRSALYDRLVRHFLRRHGADGSGDLLAFCYDFLSADPFWFADRAPDTLPEAAPGHRTLAAPAQTVFFQTAGPLLVVNRVYSGFSGMVARWAAIPALHDPIDTAVTGWLEALHPECRVYQMSAHADWIEFQRPALRGLPQTGWGPELAEASRTARDLNGFTLAFDSATGTLQATDPDGRPAAFAYLGAVPPQSLHGVDRLLATLSDPWTLAQPATGTGSGTGHQPRLQRGTIVLRRACWEFGPGDLPRAGKGQDPVDFLAAVERWRRDHGLPEEVFLTRLSPAQHHKPQWVGFRHPHTVWSALRRIDARTTGIRLTEALPAHDRHPAAPGGDGRPRATEYIAMLRQSATEEPT